MEKNIKRRIIKNEISQITKEEEKEESLMEKFKSISDYNKKDLSKFGNIFKDGNSKSIEDDDE